MAPKSSILSALSALAFIASQASAIAIVDENICPIPYVVPRAFQQESDPVDEHVTEQMWPSSLDKTYKGQSPEYLSSMLIRTTPNVWTFEPYCIRSMAARGDICVFTSEWFAKGRGISIVAAAGEAPLIAKASSLKNQTLHEWQDWVNPAKDERVEVMPIPQKGMGVRAKRVLERGDAAQSFTPVISVQDGIMQLRTDAWEQTTPLIRAVRQLPKYSRDVFNALHGEFGGNAEYDKINTNAFNAVIGKSEHYFWSVYPETSRYNHDCRPNTMYSIEEDDLTHNLRVGRRIIHGEEVTLSYLSPNLPHQERNARMTKQWGFKCSCPACTAPQDVITMSDYRIQLIEELEGELNDLSEGRNATVETAEMLITLHEQERLDGVIGDAYMYAAFEHAYLGDRRATQKYATLACEHMAIWRGAKHPYYLAMQRLLVDPTTERSWLYFGDEKRAERKKLEEFQAKQAAAVAAEKAAEKADSDIPQI